MTDNRISRRTALALAVSIVLISSAGSGQTQNLSDVLGLCLSEHTLAVVRVDLTRIDIDAVFDMIANIPPEPEARQDIAKALEQHKQELQDDLRLSQLLSSGATTAYLVFNTDDLPYPLVAIPVSTSSDETRIVAWLESGPFRIGETLRKGDLILASSESVLGRWKDKPGMRRPDLDRAGAAAQRGAVHVFLAPNADARRVIEALLSSWPEPRFSIPAGAIANGLQWATLTLEWPPQLSLDLHIEAADPTSATVLGHTLRGMLDAIGTLPRANESLPNLGQVLEGLRPRIEDRVTRLTLDRQQAARLIADLLQQIREDTQQAACRLRLRQIMLAVYMYTQRHDGQFPPDIQTVVDAGIAPAEVLLCQGRPYIYRGADLPNLSMPHMTIIVHDQADAHRGGRNVAFVDGHAEWVTEEQFHELIERDNEFRRQRGLPEKPAQ